MKTSYFTMQKEYLMSLGLLLILLYGCAPVGKVTEAITPQPLTVRDIAQSPPPSPVFPLSIQQGWNLISLPGVTSPGNMYKLENNQWQPFTGTVEKNKAYFLDAAATTEISISGEEDGSLSLVQGWNAFGVLTPKSLSGLRLVKDNTPYSFAEAAQRGFIRNTVYSFSGGTYHSLDAGSSDALSVGTGYLVYAEQPMRLLFVPCNEWAERCTATTMMRQTCLGGEFADNPCPQGQECNPFQNSCIVAPVCNDDSNCPTDRQKCDPATNTCGYCHASADCAAGEACIPDENNVNQCVNECSGEADDTSCSLGSCSNDVCAGDLCANDVRDVGSETDIDCGGTQCSPCSPGQACTIGTDCSSQVCTGNICAEPSCTDGVRNGDESDVDCGEECPAKCAAGKTCIFPEDCASNSCNANHQCAAAPVIFTGDNFEDGDYTQNPGWEVIPLSGSMLEHYIVGPFMIFPSHFWLYGWDVEYAVPSTQTYGTWSFDYSSPLDGGNYPRDPKVYFIASQQDMLQQNSQKNGYYLSLTPLNIVKVTGDQEEIIPLNKRDNNQFGEGHDTPTLESGKVKGFIRSVRITREQNGRFIVENSAGTYEGIDNNPLVISSYFVITGPPAVYDSSYTGIKHKTNPFYIDNIQLTPLTEVPPIVKCQPDNKNPGEKQCSSTGIPQTCQQDGSWSNDQSSPCTYGCENGACKAALFTGDNFEDGNLENPHWNVIHHGNQQPQENDVKVEGTSITSRWPQSDAHGKWLYGHNAMVATPATQAYGRWDFYLFNYHPYRSDRRTKPRVYFIASYEDMLTTNQRSGYYFYMDRGETDGPYAASQVGIKKVNNGQETTIVSGAPTSDEFTGGVTYVTIQRDATGKFTLQVDDRTFEGTDNEITTTNQFVVTGEPFVIGDFYGPSIYSGTTYFAIDNILAP